MYSGDFFQALSSECTCIRIEGCLLVYLISPILLVGDVCFGPLVSSPRPIKVPCPVWASLFRRVLHWPSGRGDVLCHLPLLCTSSAYCKDAWRVCVCM